MWYVIEVDRISIFEGKTLSKVEADVAEYCKAPTVTSVTEYDKDDNEIEWDVAESQKRIDAVILAASRSVNR